MRKFLYIIALPLLSKLIIMIFAWTALAQSCKDCSHFRDFLPETYKILFYVRKIKKERLRCVTAYKFRERKVFLYDKPL